jgi:Na+/proline symporter
MGALIYNQSSYGLSFFALIVLLSSDVLSYFTQIQIVVAALTSQAIDSNALLGAATLSYKFQFWDGVVLPLGLGLSLILNSLLLASKINADNVLTLPDVFAKRYGKLVEVMVSTCTIISFLCLLAGNLVGMGAIISYVVTIPMQGAIWMAAASVLFFTIAGGLFSIAYTGKYSLPIEVYIHLKVKV